MQQNHFTSANVKNDSRNSSIRETATYLPKVSISRSGRQTGRPMGQPYSTVLMSPPIIRLSSLSSSFSHSLTGSVPEAVLKNLAGRIFSESFMRILYHIWYNMSSLELYCNSLNRADYLSSPPASPAANVFGTLEETAT